MDKGTIPWISRHDMTHGQFETLKIIGYSGFYKNDITFTSDPVDDLVKANILDRTIALVAPSYVVLKLLNADYRLIEFVNESSKRAKGVFTCKGAYIHEMEGCSIKSTYVECPIPVEKQDEASLAPPSRTK